MSGDIIGKMLKNLKTRGYFYGDESEFMTAFKKKGRLSSIFKDIPVVVVTPDPIKLPLGVRGAFLYAKRVGETERNEIISGIITAAINPICFVNRVPQPNISFIKKGT